MGKCEMASLNVPWTCFYFFLIFFIFNLITAKSIIVINYEYYLDTNYINFLNLIFTIYDQESLKPDSLSPGHAFPKICKNIKKLKKNECNLV